MCSSNVFTLTVENVWFKWYLDVTFLVSLLFCYALLSFVKILISILYIEELITSVLFIQFESHSLKISFHDI